MHLGSEADPGVIQWLEHVGGEEALACLSHVTGPDIEQLIELLARRCYKSFAVGLNPNVTKIRTDSAEYHENIAANRHGSVVAHGHVTYAFEDVSRVFTHEIVRNWVGNERSQESLRYVRLTDLRFWIPPIIARETKSISMLGPYIPGTYSIYKGIPVLDLTPEKIFEIVIETCEWGQAALATYFDIDSEKSFGRKKKLTSAFRRMAKGLRDSLGRGCRFG